MTSTEAYETLLIKPQDLEKVQTARETWDSFAENKDSISAAQEIQFFGAWRSYPEKRDLLLDMLENWLEERQYNADGMDFIKLWNALAFDTSKSEAITQQRMKFISMASKLELWKDAPVSLASELVDRTASGLNILPIRECFDYVKKFCGDGEVKNLLFRKVDSLIYILGCPYRPEQAPDAVDIWNHILDNHDTRWLTDPNQAAKFVNNWIKCGVMERSVYNPNQPYALPLEQLRALIEPVLNNPMDPTWCLGKLIDLQPVIGTQKNPRLEEMATLLLTAGADPGVIDDPQFNSLTSSWFLDYIRHHPVVIRDKLREVVGEIHAPKPPRPAF